VEYTEEQLVAFKAEFAKRQRRQLAVAAVIFAGAILVMIMRNRSPLESPVGLALLIGAMAAILIFTLQNWRCPACEKYLGKGGFPRFCPRCGVALK
jgi:peptidoglycan/LPS O-acetylase OafA/YrhL